MLTLLPVAQSELSPADQAFRACMMDRFGTQRERGPAVPEPFARDVLEAYRAYWRAALLRPDQGEVYEARLLARLRALAARPQAADLDAVEPVVRVRLEAAGYQAQLGRSGTLRELVLSRREDFASRGWRDYATCGRNAMR